jgi:polyhydroxybutyrate depolymerase
MNFILVAINGSIQEVSSSWNAGTCCSTSTDYQVNDLLLTEKIIDSIKHQYIIDTARIWAVGHSNGGMMTFHLACDLSESITAIALVGGALMDDSCSPSKPVSIYQVHGNQDPTIPFTGGGKFNVPDIASSISTVNSKFDCTKTTDGFLPLNNVEQSAWNCPLGTQVKLTNFLENGHEWHLEYTKYILRFLFAHPRK